MTYGGAEFYDDPHVFDTYSRRRERGENPNDTLERPVVYELLGDVQGLEFLDIGCGDAAFGTDLLARGALSYLGVDGSANMIDSAKRSLAGTSGKAVRANLEEWVYPVDRFDRATARLVLHYLAGLDQVYAQVHRALRRNGLFVLSVEHPVITSSDQGWDGAGPRGAWLVDNYFLTGRRVTTWMGAEIVKYHRTVEDHFLALMRAGFTVESVRESQPQRHSFTDEETFKRRQRIPLFLFMSARKA